jgi:hypothetical protein
MPVTPSRADLCLLYSGQLAEVAALLKSATNGRSAAQRKGLFDQLVVPPTRITVTPPDTSD